MKAQIDFYCNILLSDDESKKIFEQITISSDQELLDFIALVDEVAADHAESELEKLFNLLKSKLPIFVSPEATERLFQLILKHSKCTFSKTALVNILDKLQVSLSFDQQLKLLTQMAKAPRVVYCNKSVRRILSKHLHFAPTDLFTFEHSFRLHFALIECFTQENDPEVLFNVFNYLYKLKVNNYLSFVQNRTLEHFVYSQNDSYSAARLKHMSTANPEQQILQQMDELNQLHFNFLSDYTPISFTQLPEHTISNSDLQNALKKCLIQPGTQFELYQLLTERMHEVEAHERKMLLEIMEAALKYNFEAQKNVMNAKGNNFQEFMHDVYKMSGFDAEIVEEFNNSQDIKGNHTTEAAQQNEEQMKQIADLFSLTSYGFTIDLYYYVVNLFIFDFHTESYIETCKNILKYLVVEENTAQLCLEQIIRDFEFEKDDIKLKEGCLQLILLFQYNLPYQMRLSEVVERIADKLTQEVQADSFIYYKIFYLIFDHIQSGIYSEKLFAKISKEVEISHVINDLITKQGKYDIQHLTGLITLLYKEQVMEIQQSGISWIDKYVNCVKHNQSIKISEIINDVVMVKFFVQQKLVEVEFDGIDASKIDLQTVRLFNAEQLKAMFGTGENIPKQTYINLINQTKSYCFQGDLIQKYYASSKSFEYINAFAIYLAFDSARVQEYAKNYQSESVNLFLVILSLQNRRVSTPEMEWILTRLNQENIDYACLVHSISLLVYNQYFPKLMSNFNSLDHLALCVINLKEDQLKFVSTEPFQSTLDLTQVNIVKALTILVKNNRIQNKDITKYIVDVLGTNETLFKAQLKLLEQMVKTHSYEQNEKNEIVHKLNQFLESDNESTRNQVRKVRLCWMRK
ncbi:Conserved_hypothetical protein [Hexamita inflata]|uniref:Uncharacterized protein n=1 Tax=Hexamita inflata TaxID=28002 RepID=A0AA86UWF1_9EUKA|nr:Conserved hypothetical protein [Hexamita inflata]